MKPKPKLSKNLQAINALDKAIAQTEKLIQKTEQFSQELLGKLRQ
jgi:hypothetical protein